MTEANAELRVIQEYESLRRKQQTMIGDFLKLLPRIDNLNEQRVWQVRDALFHADHPFLMVFVGPFSSGKSSIINALLGADELLRIGPTPTTDRITILRWGDEPQHLTGTGDTDTVYHPAPLLKKVSLVDTPGLESVFREHEEATRRFLHRSDVVVLVMLATQAMSQGNLDVLKTFKEYGKKVILAINQVDLLSEEDRQTVRDYVVNQSKDRLGFQPLVWMISARTGQGARSTEGIDQEKWRASGLQQFEEFVEKQLGDVERLRMKLQTPLQIVHGAHQSALDAVRANQSVFDHLRSIQENVDEQISAQKRGQEKTVREINLEIEQRFTTTADRSGEALQDIFQFSRALGSLGRGLLELTGLMRLFRRGAAPSYVEQTFQRFKVFDPIDELPGIVDKLGPRLEGQDMQDIDGLVTYGQREVAAMSPTLREKLIGTIQAPARYDRTALQEIRGELEAVEQEARVVETDKVEQVRRNTLLYLAAWELMIVILLVALVSAWGALEASAEGPLNWILLVALLSAAMLGFAAIPLRGRAIHATYTNRLLKQQARYTEILTRAVDRQIEYGVQLRRDAIAPLTRLVEAQTSIQDSQMNQLKEIEHEILEIESGLNALGKRKILGLTL